jgi:LuxR family maltose regulon positive regulatory protein
MKISSVLKISRQTVHIPRRLEEKLAAITEYPYTEIAAPIGFGKTTAIREFMKREETLHPDLLFSFQTIREGEESWFWEDFCLRFEELAPDFSRSIREKGLPVDQTGRRAFLRMLDRLLHTLSKKVILILDMGCFVPDQETCEFFEYIIRSGSVNFHLVIITRQFIFSQHSFSRYYGLVNRISVRDFVFSAQDIESYYRLFNISLTPKEIQHLCSLSEGWIILVCENLKTIWETGTGITEKYAERVIDRMIYDPLPQEYKDILSWIGFCKSFSLEQAEYIVTRSNAAEILTDLVRKDLFIRFNESTQEYSLENCFSSCIQRKCSGLTSGEKSSRLKKIGDWYMKARQWYYARGFYYQAGDFNALMQGVEERRFTVPYAFDDHLFVSYYADCPPEIRIRYPKAILIFAKYLFNSNRRDLSKKVGSEFLTAIKENPNLTEKEIRRYEAMYELFLTYEQYNNLENMLKHLNKTVKLITDEEEGFLWPETGVQEIPSILYMYHRKPGDLEREVRLFTEYNSLYTRFTGDRTAGEELVMEAEARYMIGDSIEAEIRVYKARVITNSAKQWGVWMAAIYLQIRIELEKGNWPRVEMFLEEAKTTHLPNLDDRYLFLSAGDICQAYVSCKLDQPQTLSSLFREGWDIHFNYNFKALAPICVLHAEVLLARKEFIALIALADSYLATARIYPNLLVEIMLEIEIAGAYERIGERNNALSHLNHALVLAVPDRIIMPFVEFAKYISPLFHQVSREIDAEFIKTVYQRAQDFREKLNMIRLNFFSKELYHLTQQEVKIARLAAEGYSNQEIAETMFIQESTVKTHLTHVFSKLDIEKRSQLRTLFNIKKVVDKKSDLS